MVQHPGPVLFATQEVAFLACHEISNSIEEIKRWRYKSLID